MEQLLHVVEGNEDAPPPLVMDWGTRCMPTTVSVPLTASSRGLGKHARGEPVPVEERATTVHRFGRRISGMTFSPGGDVSMVIYDKVLQSRLSGKRHMEPIWLAAGWQSGVPVTRHEARVRRPAVRELGLVGEVRSCLDDPWEFLGQKKDVFAAVVGRSEPCPDATDVAWIRRVVPDADNANRSRWPTDPVWRVVQGAIFAAAPAEARRLIRRRQRGANVSVLDRGQFGYLVSRVAHLHPNGGEWTLSRALGGALPALEAVEAKKQARTGNDFGELVRERRRQRGLPLPLADKVLPVRTGANTAPIEEALSVQSPYDEAGRLAEAWLRLDEAERRGANARTLRALEAAYLREVATSEVLLADRGAAVNRSPDVSRA
jgi:hypothetical protein